MYLGLIIIGSGFRFVHLDMRETIIMIYQWGLVHIHPFEEQVLVNGFVCLVRTQTVAHRMANPPKKKKRSEFRCFVFGICSNTYLSSQLKAW